MEKLTVKFDIVEDTLEQRLRAMGRNPQRQEGCVLTGYDYLHLHRGEIQVLAVEESTAIFASVEFNAVLRHPLLGEAVIVDMVTTQADSPETTLAQCANYYMDVTFPALQALFDPAVAASRPAIKLASYTQPERRLINWKVFTGQLQILNSAESGSSAQGGLSAYLDQQPPLALVLDTLSGYLGTPRLHWCRLYGAITPKAELVFGCSIDGEKSPAAEAEMRRKFHSPTPDSNVSESNAWEFRQFFVCFPSGEPDEKLAAELRQRTNQPARPRKLGWIFGKRS